MFDSLSQELHLFRFAGESCKELALVEGSLHQDLEVCNSQIKIFTWKFVAC